MIKTFAEAEKVLAEALPNYTARPAQQRLAAFVEDTIATEGHALAEAGTGTGKSLATVIPGILSGKAVVVATATKALQDQYSNKDLPFLQNYLGVPFTWANLKGRSNYLCMAKALDGAELAKAPNGAALLAEVNDNEDHDGDFDNFEADVDGKDRWALSMSADECPGKDCPFVEQCYAQKAKKRAQESQVVITNDMMLLTDIKLRNATGGKATMLGAYDLLLVDEAHELEDWTTKALEATIKERGITNLVGEAENFARANGGNVSGKKVMEAYKAAWRLLPADGERLALSWWVKNAEPFMDLREALLDLGEQLASVRVTGETNSTKKARIRTRCANEARDLAAALTEEDGQLVRWVEEVSQQGGRVKNIKTAPVHVGAWLNENIWSQTSAVLLSATLSISGKFDYIAGRLGLPAEATSLSVGTPFDYPTQAMLFVPPANMPSPKERGAWLGYSSMATRELVSASQGGALLLYTSRSAMEQAYANLAPMFAEMGITTLMQGQKPNPVLAKEFAEDTHSVLFALKSFMTGVDFQGDTCRLVIVDKLTFPVPTEPVFAARSQEVEQSGKSAFSNLSIPSMTLTLLQAFGRLIRTSEDHGVVAILDSRLSNTGWGKGIVRNLPDAPVTTDISAVRNFYGAR